MDNDLKPRSSDTGGEVMPEREGRSRARYFRQPCGTRDESMGRRNVCRCRVDGMN